MDRLATEGETCGGHNGVTGRPFANCAEGLVCQSTGGFGIPGTHNVCMKELAYEDETCEGFDYMSNRPYPSCGKGLICEESGRMTIPGAEKICRSYKNPRPLAGEGQTCEGFNESTGRAYPSCAKGLSCVYKRGVFSDPGAEKECRKEEKVAGPGENCEGHNEVTGEAFPRCDDGLVCVPHGGITIPGRENVCISKNLSIRP